MNNEFLYSLNNATLGEKIKALREKANLSVDDLYKETGIAGSTICKIERNEVDCKCLTLIDLANFFDVSIDWLLGRTQAVSLDDEIRFICDYIHLNEKAVDSLHEPEFPFDVYDSDIDKYKNAYYNKINDIVSNFNFANLIFDLVKCDIDISSLNYLKNEINNNDDEYETREIMDEVFEDLDQFLKELKLRLFDIENNINLVITKNLANRFNEVKNIVLEYKIEKKHALNKQLGRIYDDEVPDLTQFWSDYIAERKEENKQYERKVRKLNRQYERRHKKVLNLLKKSEQKANE